MNKNELLKIVRQIYIFLWNKKENQFTWFVMNQLVGIKNII